MTKLRKELLAMAKFLALTAFQGLILYTIHLFSPNHAQQNKKVLLQNRFRTLHQNNGFFTKITDSPPKYVGVCPSSSLATR